MVEPGNLRCKKCAVMMVAFALFAAPAFAQGDFLWVNAARGSSGQGVAVDALDNIVVTGDFSRTTDFGGGGLVAVGSNDVFVAKYDSDGNHIWSHRYGGSAREYGKGVAVDAAEPPCRVTRRGFSTCSSASPARVIEI